jgi:hypothetical protein
MKTTKNERLFNHLIKNGWKQAEDDNGIYYHKDGVCIHLNKNGRFDVTKCTIYLLHDGFIEVQPHSLKLYSFIDD